MRGQSDLRPLDCAFREGIDYRITDAGCWEWLRYVNPGGYGECGHVAGERLAHRASYALANGPLERGGHVHHKCENKRCVNPAHLEHHTPSVHRLIHRQAESTLTWDDVRAIREANRAGVGIYELAETYGLSLGTLHPLTLNRTWVDPDYEPGIDVDCARCGETFRATKINKRFCSTKCRQAFNNAKKPDRGLRRAA